MNILNFLQQRLRPCCLLLWASAALLVTACEKPTPESAAASGAPAPQDFSDMASASTGSSNPFSLAIMRQAYDSLVAKRTVKLRQRHEIGGATSYPATEGSAIAAPGGGLPGGSTHLYVRFRPANTDQLADLDAAGYELSWEPLDETAAAATTVDFTSSTIPWIYTVVNPDEPMPANIQTEVLEQLFLFDTDAGDAQDDPWVPDPIEPFFTGVVDNVTAYITASVFGGLQPNVTTVRGYQAEVLAQNTQLQAAQLNQLVTSYRW